MKKVHRGDRYTPKDGEALILVVEGKEYPVRFCLLSSKFSNKKTPLCSGCPLSDRGHGLTKKGSKIEAVCQDWIYPYYGLDKATLCMWWCRWKTTWSEFPYISMTTNIGEFLCQQINSL